MCAILDEDAKEKFIKTNKKGWFYGYKRINKKTNQAMIAKNKIYRLGWNYAYWNGKRLTKDFIYYSFDPKGIHVYLEKDFESSTFSKQIRVKCYINDLIGIERGIHAQAVLRKIYIQSLRGLKNV